MEDFFDDFEMKVWGGFVYTQGKLFQIIEEDLRRNSGITHSEFEVLLRLFFAKNNKARIQDLANASLLSRSGTSRAIGRLVQAGLVERMNSEEDGRCALAFLTPQGAETFRKAVAHHSKLVRNRFLNKLTLEEKHCMAQCWAKIRMG